MAHTLFFFMTPEDELSFLRGIESFGFEIYPEASPRGFRPFPANAAAVPLLTDEAYYLALPKAGELVAREIRKGPHKGMLELDEVRSPVIHWERSRMEEDELRSGKLWSELDVVGDRQRLMTKPDLLRGVFDQLRSFLKKHFRHSQPAGFFIGPIAARRANEGLALREAGRKGELVVPYK
ncbi:MAG: hypothetical protein HY901_28295 [Deltaproteobacteria bacterium]|nr:hypothetical protein [Deltaproteobacteria bacterium]